MKRMVGAALMLLGCASTVAGEMLKIDTNHSTVGFSVPIVKGISKVTGKFTGFEVDLDWNAQEPKSSSVKITIDAATVNTGNEQRDGHLRTADFFDVENHPHIVFESTSIERAKEGYVAVGTLTMRGVRKPVRVPFTALEQPQGDGDRWFAFAVKTTLNRRDYGITWRHTDIAFFVGDAIEADIVLITR